MKLFPVILLGVLGACASSDSAEVHGKGVLAFDREPPAGARLFECPSWTEGDQFIYLRGGMLRLPLRVWAGEDGGFVLENEDNGVKTLLSADLNLTGLEEPGEPMAQRSDPAETWLHWPLWVGKRWSCNFVNRRPGQPPLPLVITYHCDAIETIDVPAGKFECLRIWRRARVASKRKYLERTSILWYAPQVGYFARRLENGTLLELEQFHRQ